MDHAAVRPREHGPKMRRVKPLQGRVASTTGARSAKKGSVDVDGLVEELADRFRSVVPDGFHVAVGSDGIVWFSCDDGRFPGQRGDFKPGTAGTHLRSNLLTVPGTDAERVVMAVRQALDDLQDYIDEASHEPWPGRHRPPRARAEVREGLLHCWYVDGGDVVLELDPVPLIGRTP